MKHFVRIKICTRNNVPQGSLVDLYAIYNRLSLTGPNYRKIPSQHLRSQYIYIIGLYNFRAEKTLRCLKVLSFVIFLDFDIVQPEAGIPSAGQPIADMSNYPILDEDSDKTKKMVIPIKNTCGDDGCQSDLTISASLPEEIILGKNRTQKIFLPGGSISVCCRNDIGERQIAPDAQGAYYIVIGLLMIEIY